MNDWIPWWEREASRSPSPSSPPEHALVRLKDALRELTHRRDVVEALFRSSPSMITPAWTAMMEQLVRELWAGLRHAENVAIQPDFPDFVFRCGSRCRICSVRRPAATGASLEATDTLPVYPTASLEPPIRTPSIIQQTSEEAESALREVRERLDRGEDPATVADFIDGALASRPDKTLTAPQKMARDTIIKRGGCAAIDRKQNQICIQPKGHAGQCFEDTSPRAAKAEKAAMQEGRIDLLEGALRRCREEALSDPAAGAGEPWASVVVAIVDEVVPREVGDVRIVVDRGTSTRSVSGASPTGSEE